MVLIELEEKKTRKKRELPANATPFRKGEERAREAGRRGGEASAITRAKRKSMQNTLDTLLSLKMSASELCDIATAGSMDELLHKNITTQEAILLAMMYQALDGNVKAATFLRETVGDTLADKIDISANVETNKLESILNQLKE